MKIEIIFVSLVALAIFTAILYGSKRSMIFQQSCDDSCAPQAAITPVIGGKEVCFCSVGQGMWRRIDEGTD
jgi:hypothetical protein